MLIKGKSSFSQQSLSDISNNILSCNINAIVKTPSSSSGVPGPVVELYLDPAIPLYHYTGTNNRNYGLINSTDNSHWTTYTTNDISMEQSILSELFTLYIHNNITQSYYTYSFSTPVAIYVKGLSSSIGKSLTATISNVYIYVYYNSTLITTNNPNLSGTSTTIPILTSDFISLGLKTTTVSDFSAVFYSGVLTVSNLLLFTQPGFIYDIKLAFNIGITTDSSVTINSYGTYCNVSAYNNLVTGCRLTTSVSTDTNTGFIFG
jgi:hypothetical protein